MAGGIGSRFWPLSTSSKPKQFLDVLGTGNTLLQLTFERIQRFCPKENIFIVTNKMYIHLYNTHNYLKIDVHLRDLLLVVHSNFQD